MTSRTRGFFAKLASFPIAPIALAGAALTGCGSSLVMLNPPQTMARAAQAGTTPIDFEAITLPRVEDPVVPGDLKLAPPPPADVLTSALRSEIHSRAFHGGDAAGYTVKCRLDRFALRTDTQLRYAIALLYIDLNCTVLAKTDGSIAWRGELRGRGIGAGGKKEFDGEDAMWQAFTDRSFSDVTRELVSDLGIGALGLKGTAGVRAFSNDDTEKATASVDDSTLGPVVLAEDVALTRRDAVPELQSRISPMRATAWNAVAMSSFPDEPWIGGVDTVLDVDAFVRFFQYKALARHGSRATLTELRRAYKIENQDLLKELLKDLVASDGLNFPRQARIPQDAQTTNMNGDDTRP
ncbi:MAG: hypothetical protein ABI461_04765 [Polyangiaceae bacterium]